MPRALGAFNINYLQALPFVRPWAAMLRHRGRGAPRREAPRRPGGELARGNGGAQRAHEADVEVEVVDRVEARAQDLVAAVEMAQVGAGVVAAGVTGAGRGGGGGGGLISAGGEV